MDNQSLSHTRWNCTYHIVFIPKFRRKVMYGELKKDIADILKHLCEMSEAELIEGTVCADLQWSHRVGQVFGKLS